MIATRREVLSPDEPGGLPVAVRSDAFLVHKTSERVIGLMDSEADVSRLRLLVEGSRRFEAGGGTLTPYTGLILGEGARTYRAGRYPLAGGARGDSFARGRARRRDRRRRSGSEEGRGRPDGG